MTWNHLEVISDSGNPWQPLPAPSCLSKIVKSRSKSLKFTAGSLLNIHKDLLIQFGIIIPAYIAFKICFERSSSRVFTLKWTKKVLATKITAIG